MGAKGGFVEGEWANVFWNWQESGIGSKVIVWAFLLAVVAVGASVVRSLVAGQKVYVCKACGTVGKAKSITPGSFIIELFLWLMAIVPGILYSVYRATKRYNACFHCKGRDIIPKDSPIAERFIKDNSLDESNPEDGISNWPPKPVSNANQ